MLRLVPLVLKNLARNKLRSLLTTASIAISLGILGVLLSLSHLFYFNKGTEEDALRLIVRNRISLTNTMPKAYGPKIKAVPGVKEVHEQQWFQGVWKSDDFNNFFPRFACDVATLFTVYPEWKVTEEHKKAVLADRTGCLVGMGTAKKHGFKIGDRIPIAGDIFPVDLVFTVRGFYDSVQDNENLQFHYEYLRESLPASQRGDTGTYVVLADSPQSVPKVARAIDEMFKNSPAETKTETERAFKLSFLAFLGNVKMFLLVVCLAVMFMLLLVSGNTMALSVRERVQEIGVMKTLGFSRGAVATLIVGESVLIAMIGALIGLAFSTWFCGWWAAQPTAFLDVKLLHVPPIVLGAGFAVAFLIGFVSSVVPAGGASRKAIVDCLRVVD